MLIFKVGAAMRQLLYSYYSILYYSIKKELRKTILVRLSGFIRSPKSLETYQVKLFESSNEFKCR